MYCPMKFNSSTIDITGTPASSSTLPLQCVKEGCAWWEQHTGTCCIATQSYLKGIEVARQEMKESHE